MPPGKAKEPRKKAAARTYPATARQSRGARIRGRRGSVRDRSSGIHVRKLPRQERSRLMVESILEAAAEIFADLGYARATTNKIAERAGVSVGSLYQYFPNKDSLLAGLLAQHQADVHRVVGAALDRLADPATPIEAALRQLLTDLVALHHADPALTRALSAAVLRESPAAEDAHKEDDARLRRIVAVLDCRPDIRAGDRAAMALVLGQATAHLTRWLVHDAPRFMEPAILEEIVQLLVRFLAHPRD